MKTISETAASKDLASLVEEVWESRVPVAIHRENGHSVVVIPQEDYEPKPKFVYDPAIHDLRKGKPEGMDETEYLLADPENARVLLQAVADCKAGINMQERELIEE